MANADLAGLFCLAPRRRRHPDSPEGAVVTVLTAARYRFSNLVEVTGIVLAREETAVRRERQGLKVAEVLADAGDIETAQATAPYLNPAHRNPAR